MTDWSDIARATIEKVALTIPEGTPLKERKKLLEAAYPFHFADGAYWPRRAWQKARKHYLARFEPQKPTEMFPNMERDPVTGRPVNR